MNLTVQQILYDAEKLLSEKVDSARLDAEIILEYVTKKERTFFHIHPETKLSLKEISEFKSLIKRRINFEPVAYITGIKEFYGLKFKVNKNVFIPRPETELILDELFSTIPNDFNGRILDLGTGCGCLAIVIKKRLKKAKVYASDISKDALKVAKENLVLLKTGNINFILSDKFEKISGKFEIIVCNPPYIPESAKIEPSVKNYEPHTALFGGKDGLSFIHPFLEEVPQHLKKNGILLMECGIETSGLIPKILPVSLKINKIIKDLSGKDRIVVIKKV